MKFNTLQILLLHICLNSFTGLAQNTVNLNTKGLLKFAVNPNNDVFTAVNQLDSLHLNLFTVWGNKIADTVFYSRYNYQTHQPIWHNNAFYIINFISANQMQLLKYDGLLKLKESVLLKTNGIFNSNTFTNLVLVNDSFYFLTRAVFSDTTYFIAGNLSNGNTTIKQKLLNGLKIGNNLLLYDKQNFYCSNIFIDTLTVFNQTEIKHYYLKGISLDFNYQIVNNTIYTFTLNVLRRSYTFKKYNLNLEYLDSFNYFLPAGCIDNFGYVNKINRFVHNVDETFYLANEYLLPGNNQDKLHFIAEVNYKTKSLNFIESNINQKTNYIITPVANYQPIYGYNLDTNGMVNIVFPSFNYRCQTYTYPNPSGNAFSIPLNNTCVNESALIGVKLYNYLGKELTNFNITYTNYHLLDIQANLPSGLYYIKLSLNQNEVILKHVIAN